jgi:hypothetical protein
MPKQEGAPEDNVPPEFTLPLVDQVKQAGEDVELSVTGNTEFVLQVHVFKITEDVISLLIFPNV